MPTVGLRNAEAQQIGSTDHLTVENKNFSGEWYDSVGGTSFIGTTVVPLAGERLNPAPEIFSMSSNILTILEAGIYFFIFNITVSQVGSSELIWIANLEQDPATGSFSAVSGTQSANTFFNGRGTLNNHAILDVKANYRYRLVAARVGGTSSPTFFQNDSKLSVIRLYKNG